MPNLIEKLILTTVVTSSLFLGGCARDISANTYHDRAVGETAHTFRGHIISVRPVTVAPEQLEENFAGAAIGGVLGGVGGSFLGKGHGNTAATALGAIGGLVAGSMIEKELKTQNALEYVVELRNGELRTVVQGPQPAFGVGQDVLLMVTHRGRSRITAA